MSARVKLIFCALVLILSLACGLPATVAPAPTDTARPPRPTSEAGTGGVIQSSPTPDSTSPAAGLAEAALDPCTLLTRDEAAAFLGEPVNEPKINGGACTYANSASGVYVLSAYAFQGEQAKNQWSGRVFLLSMFGLQLDQAAMDEVMQLDAAGDQKAVLEKISLAAAGNPSFSSRSLDGLGEIAYWAWKDLGGVYQGFLVAVKGDVIAGTDIVHGPNLDEAAALDQAGKLVLRIFERLPARFVVGQPTQTPQILPVTESPTLIPSPTLVPPALPSPTLVPPFLPTPTQIGGGGN